MSYLYPIEIEWRDCKTQHPKTYDTIIGEIIVIYKDVRADELAVTRARWNGIEWRTDDFGGLTQKINLFDSDQYIPTKWAVITLPDYV